MATTDHNEITLIKRNQSKVVRPLALSSRQTQPEQSHKFMLIANAIFYNGTQPDKVYLGENLVWEKEAVTPPTPTYGSNVLAGKFTDNSNSSHWYWMPNYQKTSLLSATNPTTKEFYLELDGPLTTDKSTINGLNLFSPATNYNYFERIDNIPDTSNLTIFQGTFQYNRYLTSVNLSNINTSKGTVFGSMFFFCSALTTIDLSGFDTSKAVDMTLMFDQCESLTTLDLSGFNTSKVTKMESIFGNCTALTTINLSGWDFGVCTNAKYMFDYDTALTTVLGPITGIAVDLDLKHCPLTVESAMTFINGLAQVGTAKTITFRQVTYDSLTPEQIAVATSKGWSVLRSFM